MILYMCENLHYIVNLLFRKPTILVSQSFLFWHVEDGEVKMDKGKVIQGHAGAEWLL